ncbi:MAG: hypothetical protein CMG60_04430 [Candidatus Marinimicrobia bacterium]|nr:hypothetical protein [Candidatus Neomarinimicrobiota bacterium]
MSIFNQLVSLWKSKDLLSQAWDESLEMINLSNTMFISAIKYLKKGEKSKKIKKLKKTDQEINDFQKSVRKKVVTHFSISKNLEELPSGLVLLSIVVDVERLGDYTKNILDLAIHYPGKLISEELLTELNDIETEVISMFEKTIKAIENKDERAAKELLSTYKKSFASVSDQIVNSSISGNQTFQTQNQAAAVTLYSRYLKRVGAHLKNIVTTVVNPYEYIGFKTPKQL